MFRSILAVTFRISVTLISFTGLRVSRFTAATMASEWASTAAFNFFSLSFRSSAVMAFIFH